jgi:hypothetical protein
MVLAAHRRVCGPRGRRPWEAWADVTVTGGMFVQHGGPQQFIRGRLARRSRTLLTLLAAIGDRPTAAAFELG